jgi:sec-independent protein translocase protein TatA
MQQLALGSLGGSELIIVLVVVLVLFGGSQLPKLARSIGQAQREFKSGLDNDEDEKKPLP